MNITYSHIIAVPARSTTVNAELMRTLASQMGVLRGKNTIVLAMPEGKEMPVVKTAKLLSEKIKALGISAKLEIREFEAGDASSDPNEEDTAKLLKRVFDAPPEAECLVIVADLIHAQRIPGAILCDYLKSTRNIPGIEMLFGPGEAGIVDCKRLTRDCLRPNDYY